MLPNKKCKIGILSDTHISFVDEQFRQACNHAFGDCDIIFHAGDITNHNVLELFDRQLVYAVHGNCCDSTTTSRLPSRIETKLNEFTFCITHGTGPKHSIVDRLYMLYPQFDCIVFGHTHEPTVEKIGTTTLVNPGSFRQDGRWGRPGTYATITFEGGFFTARIHELPRLP